MGMFDRLLKNKVAKHEKVKKPVNYAAGNELSEDELFNVAGGMNYSPEEAQRREKLIKNMVNKVSI